MSSEEFLGFFPGHWVQYFDDGPLKDRRKALATPHFDRHEAQRKQRAGCGVFFSPNSFEGLRRVENLARVQAAFIDLDLAREGDGTSEADLRERLQSGLDALIRFARPPHAVIRTKNGLQAIWRVEPLPPAEGVVVFQETEELLINCFHADPAARDVTRVLRLPGFLHLKDPQRPFLCTLLLDDLAKKPYRLEDLRDVCRDRVVPVLNHEAGDRSRGGRKTWREGLSGVPQGQRNATAVSVAGKLLAELPEELWETGGWGGLKEWNAHNDQPLPDPELRTVFDSIVRRELAKRRSGNSGGRRAGSQAAPAQADQLVALVTADNAVLFHDQFREPHARIRIGDHWETCRVGGSEFTEWLGQLMWQRLGKAPGSETQNTAINLLAGQARFRGPTIPLDVRVAGRDGAFWYDLGDREGRAVKITPEGWEVVAHPPILFRRFSHQLPQVTPLQGGSLQQLLTFLPNLREPQQAALLLCYLVTCFVPGIPHPIASFYGPWGCAKSTASGLLLALVDPSCLGPLSLPDLGELPQLLFHHWYAVFDNIRAIPPHVSDALCRAVTGQGTSKRQLYTDDDDKIYQYHRCLCLNGINLPATEPDLLRRCVLIPLDRIPDSQRKSQQAVVREFNAVKPLLLGAVFDALSAAMRVRPAVRLRDLPCMADFAEWGCAVAEGLGIGQDTFLRLYAENVGQQHEEAVGESSVGLALAEFMDGRTVWKGTPAQLLAALEEGMPAVAGLRRAKGLPRAPCELSKQLNVLKASLEQLGITIATSRTGQSRSIEIRATSVIPVTFLSRPAAPGVLDDGVSASGVPYPAPLSARLEASITGGDASDRFTTNIRTLLTKTRNELHPFTPLS